MVMSLQFSTPFSPRTRKRPAADSLSAQHADKRHRPNLANGFSGLSIGHAVRPVDVLAVDSESIDETSVEVPVSEIGIEEVDTSSTSSSEDTVDSDSTFRNTRPRLRRKRPLQPDSVEQPTDIDEQLRPQKRFHSHVCDDTGQQFYTSGMDIDEDMEEIPRKSRRRTQWHEPEKDRR